MRRSARCSNFCRARTGNRARAQSRASPTPRHGEILGNLLSATGLRAEHVPDAHLAALAGGVLAGWLARRSVAEKKLGGAEREARQIVDHILECEKPLIAAVNGYAMGLGANVALLCDVVVAGPSAVFADTHVNMGIGAGDGGQLIWPALIGVNKAKYYLMTGDRLTGAEAEDLGLVNFLVDDDADVLPRAVEIADRLAAGPPRAIAASKMAINAYLRAVSSVVMPISLAYEDLSMRTEDHKEAVRAFQEKRPPRFIGK